MYSILDPPPVECITGTWAKALKGWCWIACRAEHIKTSAPVSTIIRSCAIISTKGIYPNGRTRKINLGMCPFAYEWKKLKPVETNLCEFASAHTRVCDSQPVFVLKESRIGIGCSLPKVGESNSEGLSD